MTSTNLISLSDTSEQQYKMRFVCFVYFFSFGFQRPKNVCVFRWWSVCTQQNVVSESEKQCSCSYDQSHEFEQFMWSVAATAVVVIRIAYACDMAWMLVVLTRSLNKLFKTNFNASCELPISVRFFAVLLRFAISRNSYKTFVARWKTDFSLCMYFHFSLAFPLTGEYFINVIFMFRSKTHSMLMLLLRITSEAGAKWKTKTKEFFILLRCWGIVRKDGKTSICFSANLWWQCWDSIHTFEKWTNFMQRMQEMKMNLLIQFQGQRIAQAH